MEKLPDCSSLSVAMPKVLPCPGGAPVREEKLLKWRSDAPLPAAGKPAMLSPISAEKQSHVGHAVQNQQLQAIEAMLELHHGRLQVALEGVEARLRLHQSELFDSSAACRIAPPSTTCSLTSDETRSDVGSFHVEYQDFEKIDLKSSEAMPCAETALHLHLTKHESHVTNAPADSRQGTPISSSYDVECGDLEKATPYYPTLGENIPSYRVNADGGDFPDSSWTLRAFIHSQVFDTLMATFICLNVALMFVDLEKKGHAVSVKLQLRHETGVWKGTDVFFEIAQHILNGVFLLEIIFRFAADRCQTFRSKANLFDIFIVAISAIDYLPRDMNLGGVNLNFLRMLRMLKLLNVLKAFRAAHAFSELRIIIKTLQSSMMALAWGCVVLFSIMLFSGILLAQLVAGVMNDEHAKVEVREWVFRYYGTGSRAFYTLFEATLSGGWPNYARRLIEDVSPWFALFWLVYVLFVVFAIMKVITAIFLQKTMKMAGADEDLMIMDKISEEERIIAKVKQFLEDSDRNGNGEMNKVDLEAMLQQPNVQKWLVGVGLDTHEVLALFAVLDDGDGEVSHDAIVRGITRICGSVRAIDTVMIMHEQHKMMKKLDHVMPHIGSSMQSTTSKLEHKRG